MNKNTNKSRKHVFAFIFPGSYLLWNRGKFYLWKRELAMTKLGENGGGVLSRSLHTEIYKTGIRTSTKLS